MRTTTSLWLALSMLPCLVHAQDDDGIRTLFSAGGGASRGGYFSVTTGYTQALNTGGMFVGGQGAWMLGHRFAIGGGGYGLVGRTYADRYDDYLRGQGVIARPSTLHFGYGGVLVEALFAHRAPVHLAVPLLIGYGGCNIDAVQVSDHVPTVDQGVTSQGFFVVQPGVRLELNVAEHARVDLGMDYRYTSDLHLTALPADAIRGLNAVITLKVGSF